MQNLCINTVFSLLYLPLLLQYYNGDESKSNLKSNSQKALKSSSVSRKKADGDGDGDRDGDKNGDGPGQKTDIIVGSKNTTTSYSSSSNPSLSKIHGKDTTRDENVAYVGCGELFADMLVSWKKKKD